MPADEKPSFDSTPVGSASLEKTHDRRARMATTKSSSSINAFHRVELSTSGKAPARCSRHARAQVWTHACELFAYASSNSSHVAVCHDGVADVSTGRRSGETTTYLSAPGVLRSYLS